MAKNFTNITTDDWKLDFEIYSKANIAVLSLYLVLGVIENSMVFLVYRFQTKETTEERYFVPILASSDLLATIVNTGITITWILMKLNFANNIACKITNFMLGFTLIMSVMLLLSIAVQRYLKMCRNRTIPLGYRRIMVFVSVVISIVMSIPLATTYGLIESSNAEGLSGKRCGKLKYDSKLRGASFGIAFCSFSIIVFMAFIFFYGRIGCTVYGHFRAQRIKRTLNRLSRRLVPAKLYTTEGISRGIEMTDHCDKAVAFKRHNNAYEEHDIAGKRNQMPPTASKSTKNQTKSKTSKSTTRNPLQKRNRRLTMKFSMMFMLITAVFLISFSPVSTVVTLDGLFTDFWERLSRRELVIVLWLYHTFIINNIVNPYIYGFMDVEFRAATKKMLQRCFSRQ